MATDRGLAITALTAVGAAALCFAALPAVWPVPGSTGAFDAAAMLPGLREAAAAVDAACARGDLAAFAAVTTAGHRQALDLRLQAFDRQLDASTLRALAATSHLERLQPDPLAGVVCGTRTAVAVPRSDGAGAQVLTFAWDGRRWLLHDSHHAQAVHDAPAAAAAVQDAVLRRSP